jgi:hypothetical protein
MALVEKKALRSKVSILMQSPLVLRDVDVLHQLPQVEVVLTVTITNDHLSRLLEVRAPRASRRLRTLQPLERSGPPGGGWERGDPTSAGVTSMCDRPSLGTRPLWEQRYRALQPGQTPEPTQRLRRPR